MEGFFMESLYGSNIARLEEVMDYLLSEINSIRNQMMEEEGLDPVEHCLSRIKSEESMREKCIRKGLPVTTDSALNKLYDAIGIRVVCAFLNDVYKIKEYITSLPDCEVVEEKDYIKHAKPNGYRSYHLIVRVKETFAEIQLRTISMDTWAALEHHVKYKKDIKGNEELFTKELKRCADELASTDISMQIIKDRIAKLPENNN